MSERVMDSEVRERGSVGTKSPGPHLAWNIKSTFRSYVEQSGGDIEVTAPAIARDDVFLFPLDSHHRESDAGIFRFTGGVRFLAHAGALDLIVEDPWLHLGDGERRVSIRGTEATRTAGGRLFMAELDPVEPDCPHDALVAVDVAAVLVADGAVAFDFRYAAGAQMAPVSYFIFSS